MLKSNTSPAGTINTDTTIKIASSPIKLLVLALFWATLAATGVYLIMKPKADTLIQFIGYCSILIYGAFGTRLAWRALTQRGTVITLTPKGIRDIRVSNDTIPWPAIASVDTWRYKDCEQMVLNLHAGEEYKRKRTLFSFALMGRRTNANRFVISPYGTKITYKALYAATNAYVRRYGKMQ